MSFLFMWQRFQCEKGAANNNIYISNLSQENLLCRSHFYTYMTRDRTFWMLAVGDGEGYAGSYTAALQSHFPTFVSFSLQQRRHGFALHSVKAAQLPRAPATCLRPYEQIASPYYFQNYFHFLSFIFFLFFSFPILKCVRTLAYI